MKSEQLSLFEPEPIRFERIAERDGVTYVTVFINGKRFEKQVEHELSNGIVAFGHNGYAYGVKIGEKR